MGSLYRLIHGTSSASSSSLANESRGRKAAFTPEVKQLLIETATGSSYNRRLPLSEVAKLAGVKASDRTLRRIFRSQGYNRRVARVKPFLDEKAKQKRLDWGLRFQDWAECDWENVIFSDKAAFNCGQLSGTIWVIHNISKKWIYVQWTQPASGRVASALCVPCALTVRQTFFLIPCAWCLPTLLYPLPCIQRACCGLPPS